MYSVSASLLALAGLVASSPVAPVPAAAPAGTLVGGPNDAHPHRANVAAAPTAPPELVTFTVVNSHTAAISTVHADNADGATPVGGPIAPGTLTVGQAAEFVVPTGWGGAVAVNDAAFAITGDDSLLQGSFDNDPNVGFAVVDVAVSFVDGFSLPIVCTCDDAIVSGCNLNLFDYGTCPTEDQDGQNGCINPNRSNGTADSAAPFFAPCQGAAYTYPNDSGANSDGACQSGHVVCCVGSDCETNPNQPTKPTRPVASNPTGTPA